MKNRLISSSAVVFYTISVVVLLVAFLMSSCSFGSRVTTPAIPTNPVINLALIRDAQPNRFINLDYGIRLNVKDIRANNHVLQRYEVPGLSMSQVYSVQHNLQVYPDVLSFVSESTRRYMRTMGFGLNADVATDYMMSFLIVEYNVAFLSGTWSAFVQFRMEIYDNNHRIVYPNVSIEGRATRSGTGLDMNEASEAINMAYANALDDIDWDRIAFFLRRSDNPKLEGNKQVDGSGNTALENTIIRWYIDSTPKGADISIRVVSSTPDVKNTNQNYVGSTPYETTESFDIRGLTFNNSGDVQIEVTCEKAGYITQRRRFNLRQAIEQKEISTKFNLVRDE